MIYLLRFKEKKNLGIRWKDVSEKFNLINTHTNHIHSLDEDSLLSRFRNHVLLIRPTLYSSCSRKLLTTKIVLLRNQLLEKELIVFIALILLLGLYQRMHMYMYIDNILCRGARLCSKEFLHRLFFLLTMYVYLYICVQSLLFSIKPTMPSKKRRERRRRKKRK
jgi:hypothetical protein